MRDDEIWLYACGSPPPSPKSLGEVEELRPRAREATLLFRSRDGLYFDRARYVFTPKGEGFDGFTARLGCVFPFERGYAAFYDAGRTILDMYEEATGLAVSTDGISFDAVSTSPWVGGTHGNVRYVYALPARDRLYIYYEYTRSDGSHELRVSIV